MSDQEGTIFAHENICPSLGEFSLTFFGACRNATFVFDDMQRHILEPRLSLVNPGPRGHHAVPPGLFVLVRSHIDRCEPAWNNLGESILGCCEYYLSWVHLMPHIPQNTLALSHLSMLLKKLTFIAIALMLSGCKDSTTTTTTLGPR